MSPKREPNICQNWFHKRQLINYQKYFKSYDLASLDPRQFFNFDP